VDQHALRVLEFAKVLDLVATETAFSLGRRRVLAIEPETALDRARERQAATAEMRLLRQMGIDVPFGGARDIRPTLQAASIGQLLDPSTLLEAANTLSTCVRARKVIERLRDRVPRLGVIADHIEDFYLFTDAVDQAITDRGEVADAASEALATARRELRIAQSRLEQRAQAAMQDAVRRGIVQEALLTERNGRKVIPIRAEARGQIAGIVHDVSSSGATVFVEPMGVVDAGNDVRELQLAEEREVRRVLQRLTDTLGSLADDAGIALDALAHLDELSALARYGDRVHAELPAAGDDCSWLHPEGATRIVRGRHPLLAGEVVPIDLDVGGDYQGILITGPNTGGKTVALKTLGLLTLMAQSGIPLPCDTGSAFCVYPRVFADIGDEQSIEQSLSTFSSHMRNIIGILDHAGPGTLVLLDELGAGTDPTEGAALARAVLETLLDRQCTFVATTHHGELKVFAHNDPRLRNANVEFDVASLSPTYRLTIGLPGQSNALAIARQLGLAPEVLDRAAAQLAPEHFEMERLLDEIRQERTAAADEHRREAIARRESEAIRRGLADDRDRIEEERLAILDEARRDAERELAAIRTTVEALKRRQERARFDAQAADETLRELDSRIATIKARAKPRRRATERPPLVRELQAGDRVHVRDIPQVGEAIGPLGEDGRVEVQFGGLRMKISVDRITSVEPPGGRERVRLPEPTGPVVPAELDLRGQRAEEALMRCDSYLDDAFRAGLPSVRIIHGKGTGALRTAIREALASNPLVRSHEPGKQNEGGDGVTIAVLAG
jgi:DNA mismatch repair protein MutS2